MEGGRSRKEVGGGRWGRQRTELSCGFGTGGRAHRLRTQPGSGLQWRPPALAGLESLLGVAGGRCTLLARQVLVAGSTHRGSELLATITGKAFRALPLVPTLHQRPEEENPAPYSVLSGIS